MYKHLIFTAAILAFIFAMGYATWPRESDYRNPQCDEVSEVDCMGFSPAPPKECCPK